MTWKLCPVSAPAVCILIGTGLTRLARLSLLPGVLCRLRRRDPTRLIWLRITGTMALQGVNAKIVSERLGSSSVAFTMDRYPHALPSMQRDAAALARALFG
jgi:hypothetical protein